MTLADTIRPRFILYLTIALAAAGSVVAWVVLARPAASAYLTAGWIVTVAVLLWWGNKGLTRWFDRTMPWSRSGSFRLFLHMLLALLFLLILMNISYVLLKVLLTTGSPTSGQIIVTNVFGAFIFIPAFSIYFSLHFLRHWRLSVLEKEKMQKEQMRSQLLSLKHQLDPHFLFNNLNILSALVDRDPVRSRRFIEKFSEVYRALLRSNTDDLVSLGEELAFIDAYMYLLQTRFDDLVRFSANVDPNHTTSVLPPLTIQMLVENAIKHNTFDERTPLHIQLLQSGDDYIIVRNTRNEKKRKAEGSGSGLKNIRERYAYFTDKPVEIIRTETHWEVRVPLLETEHP